MRSLVYIIAIEHNSSIVSNSSYSKYSIGSWEKYCNKHNIDLKIIRELDPRVSRPVWNKELIFEHGVDYDKIAIVDSDTMIMRDSVNIFDLYENEFCAVSDLIDMHWVQESIDVYSKFFSDYTLNIFNYFNAGVIFFTKDHLHIFKQLFDFYTKNRDELDNWKRGGGREQTLLNYHVQLSGIQIKFLDPSWNTMGLHTRNLMTGNWQLNDKTSHVLKYSNIIHFTGFPPEHRESLMKSCYESLEYQ